MTQNEVEMTQIDVDQTQSESPSKNALNANQVRKALRDTRQEMQNNRLDYIDPNSNHIEKTLDKVEQIHKSVQNPREAVSEAAVLYEIAVLAKERIKNVHCAFRSFNNLEFIDKLKEYMLSMENNKISKTIVEDENSENEEDVDMKEEYEEENNTQSARLKRKSTRSNNTDYVLTRPIIEKFGNEVMKYFRILPRPKFLLGSLEKELQLTKNKIVRQRKQVSKEEVETVRTKIKELDANSKDNETNNTVGETERIYELLKKIFKKVTKGAPICLYEFMINPESFSRTIENIFYISFLVKDGYAKIYLDGDNLPVIEPIDKVFKANDRATQKKNTDNIQCMISLTKPEWKEIIQVFNIETSCIPDPK